MIVAFSASITYAVFRAAGEGLDSLRDDAVVIPSYAFFKRRTLSASKGRPSNSPSVASPARSAVSTAAHRERAQTS